MNDKPTSISAEREIPASTEAIFEVLSLPENHVKLDGSGFVRSVDHGDRISDVGQVFTMNMEGEHMGGEYQVDNHVTGYSKNQRIAWKTAPAGTEPPGWEWVWTLESQGPDSTLVSVTYDWSEVTDEALLQKIGFPLVPQEGLEDSLEKLAAEVD